MTKTVASLKGEEISSRIVCDQEEEEKKAKTNIRVKNEINLSSRLQI
jgi:hypothetical protein